MRDHSAPVIEEDADAVYTVSNLFQSNDAKILLVNLGDETVEVVIGYLPAPLDYNLGRNYPDVLDDEEAMRSYVVANWIVSESAEVLSEFEWETYSYQTAKPNYHLGEVYFTCTTSEVNTAVMAAKKFLIQLEERSLHHQREFGTMRESPLDQLKE
jgi:hypothetical protein